MGIKVTDQHELPSGVTVNEHYVKIHNIELEKRSNDAFSLLIKVKGYASKDAMNEGKSHIYENTYGTQSNVAINEDIYTYSYDIVKGMYTNWEDII
jgi:hypothetical protein